MVVDERLKIFSEMPQGQHFIGADGKLYKKLSNEVDRNCWNETDDMPQNADMASLQQFVTVTTETQIRILP